MNTLENVVVGMTLTESDVHLRQYAAMLHSMGIGRRFDFVHVCTPTYATKCGASLDMLRQRLLAMVTEHAGTEQASADTRCHILEGTREDAMAGFVASRNAGLLLLGHRVNGEKKRSLSRHMAMISPASVWMVPEKSPLQIRRVLAPIDFSSHSADSLSIACGISQKAGVSECDALHVYFDSSTIRYDDAAEHIRGKEAAAFEQFARPIEKFDVAVRPYFSESSNVTHAILRVAEQNQSDLIVMNTRGRSPAAAVLLGSETSQTMMESNVPLLAVKHRGAHLNLFDVLTKPEFWSKASPHTN